MGIVVNQPKLPPNSKPIPPILPEQVVQWAWGLTIAHSGSENETDLQPQEKSIREEMKNVRQKLTDEDNKSPLKGKDIQYMDNVLAAIDGTVRTLLIIIRGRNKNFEETDSLMEMYIKKNESINNFTLSFQSAFGRVASMTFGGTSATAIVATLFPDLAVWIFPLILSGCGALFYGFYELVATPRKDRENRKARIRNDYQRDVYFLNYIERCKSALVGLLLNTFSAYETIYDKSYVNSAKSKLNDTETMRAKRNYAEKIVENALAPLGRKYYCDNIHECYRNKVFINDFNIWANCESGQGKEGCEIFKNRTGIPEKKVKIQRLEEDIEAQEKTLKKWKKELDKAKLATA